MAINQVEGGGAVTNLSQIESVLRRILGSSYRTASQLGNTTKSAELAYNLKNLRGKEVSEKDRTTLFTLARPLDLSDAAVDGLGATKVVGRPKVRATAPTGDPNADINEARRRATSGDRNELGRFLDGGASDSTSEAPSPGATTGGGGTGSGTGGGGGASSPSPAGSGRETDTPRQIPGGGELWKVGNDWYLAYTVPGTNVPLVWQVENEDRLEVIFPGGAKPDRVMSEQEFQKRSPWLGGLAAELTVHDEEPWQVFLSQHEQHLHRKPWLTDPTVIAAMAVAYLEGRTPTADELAETDWWQNHTEEERNLMVSMSDAGRAEAKEMVKQIHEQWLGRTFGKLSDQQIDKWVDRFMSGTEAAGDLLNGLKKQRQALLPDFDENLTWEQIVTPTRNLAENVWGQPFDDDRFLVDLVNKRDYNKAAQALRQEGLNRDITQVVDDALGGLQRTALGEQVVRSAI